MSREDMIMLIEAEEAFLRIESLVAEITDGHSIDCDKLNGLYNIFEVIYNNSRYADMETDFDDGSTGPEEEFRAILYAMNKTPEEKYELLVRP
ncbi:MAG: hypothetical protein IJJ64_04725 [Butyrivibrio sp.]|nr:hypothetical protein [Butyrivibrio sp.]